MALLRVGFLVGCCWLLPACSRAKSEESGRQGWDGTSTLQCPRSPNGDKQSVVITDCKADLPGKAVELNHCDVTFVRCDIKGAEYGVVVYNDATLTLKDSTIRGKVGIEANNDSSVVLERGSVEGAEHALIVGNHSTLRLDGATLRGRTGILARNEASAVLEAGRVEGTDMALHVSGGAKVTVREAATIAGRVVRESGGRVTGIPEIEREQANERVAAKFGPRVCDMAFACYGDQLGLRAGRYSVEVAADGRIVGATYQGDAAGPIRKCLLEPKSKELTGYDSGPGTIQCAYTANIGPTSRTLDRAWKFVPK